MTKSKEEQNRELEQKFEQISNQNDAIRKRNEMLEEELKKLKYKYQTLLGEHIRVTKELWKE